MQLQQRMYFKGLNGLRFWAAFFVLIYHAATYVTAISAPAVYDMRSYSFFNNGGAAVDFFFVLSGFLITTLLTGEYASNGSINVKKFYTRRALRIWPLYYLSVLILFIAPFISGHIGIDFPVTTPFQFLCYLFMLPNVAGFMGPAILPLWSVGVEEQFYLLIAPVIKKYRHRLASILLIVLVIKILLNFFAEFYLKSVHHDIALFILMLRFELICGGCLGALLLKSNYARYIATAFSYPVQVTMFGLLALIILFGKSIPAANIPVISTMYIFLFQQLWIGVLPACIFLYVILSVSLNRKSLLKTHHPVLNLLGNISYGIYIYHVMVELLLLKLGKHFFTGEKSVLLTIVYYGLSLLLTIVVAFCSYEFFEKRWLRLKYNYDPGFREQPATYRRG